MEYCHFSWTESWNLPIEYRKWYIERKRKENERIKEAQDKAHKKAPPPRAPKRPTSRQ